MAVTALARLGGSLGVYWLPVIFAAVALALIGSPETWLTLTVAGLAMGMMIFLMASGLSLVFGLMDVLNFGHSAFVTFGAFIATSLAELIDERNQVTICSAGNEFKVLQRIPMGDDEGTRASVAVANGHLYLRTTQHLFCVGK